MPNFLSEDDIEQAMVQRLQYVCGYKSLNCYTAEAADLDVDSGRTDKREVIPKIRFPETAITLNSELPEEAIARALKELCDQPRVMSPVIANRGVDHLIPNGVDVKFKDAQGGSRNEEVKAINFDNIEADQFLAVTQLWNQSTEATALAA